QSTHPRTAGVSSFGISGTNAHLILQQPPTSPDTTDSTDPALVDPGAGGVWVWPVSARSPHALSAQADRLYQLVAGDVEMDLGALAYSLAATRTQHPYRAVITGAGQGPEGPDGSGGFDGLGCRAGLLTALGALS